jgi:hypothetical protein
MSAQLALVRYITGSVPNQQEPPHQRLYLCPRELYRVPSHYRQLRVVSGRAFVTQAARDLILEAGYSASLESAQDVALVSALGEQDLILELF